MSRVIVGDCTAILKKMEAGSVNCCVTSPPYFGLRDYGHKGQIGLETSPDEYVAKLVGVFSEVRRVLRDDGTLWLNLGDSYAGGGGHCATAPSSAYSKSGEYGEALKAGGIKPQGVVKAKDLIGIPWRVAFALQADGWYLRQDIIWHKPNPMPESVTDRCTKAHEYIFLLSKSPKYYYDAATVKEDAVCTRLPGRGMTDTRVTYGQQNGGNSGLRALRNRLVDQEKTDLKRNRRSVWTVNTKPFKGAHFATFPPDLIEPCVLAGCPEGGTVLDPFFGAGTTGVVAKTLNRNYIGLEINAEYAAMARARIKGTKRCQE